MQHSPFHLHVYLHIDVRGVDICVPQPVAYHGHVIARAQEMHGGGVTDSVRINGFGCDGRAFYLCCEGVSADDVAYPEPRERCAVGVEEELLDRRVFWHTLAEITLKSLNCFRPQRTTPVFLPFAEERDLSRAVKAQVRHFQVHNFADSGSGVVEQKKQGIVPRSSAGVDLHRIQKRLHLGFFKVVDCFVRGPFEGDGPDGLTVKQQRRVFPGNEAKQRADGRQSGIPGSGSATSFLFKMIKKIKHERFVDLLNGEFLHALVQFVSPVAEEQFNGVAISEDGILCKALLDREIVAEEALYQLGQSHFVLHDV